MTIPAVVPVVFVLPTAHVPLSELSHDDYLFGFFFSGMLLFSGGLTQGLQKRFYNNAFF